MGSTSRSMVGFAVVGALLLAVPALAQNPANPDPVSYTAFDTPASGALFRWYVTSTTTTDVTIAAHGTVSFNNPEITSRAHNVDFVSDQKPQCKLARTPRPRRRRCRQRRPPGSGQERACSTNPARTGSFATTRSIST